MKKILLLLFSLVLLTAGCTQQAAQNSQVSQTAGKPPESSPSQEAMVSISNFAFDPASITISRGTTVTWINRDSVPHTVKGEDFDSGTIEPGKSYSRTFDNAGTSGYHCSIHPSMTGAVVVQ